MELLTTARELLGWCAVLNIGLLSLSTLMVVGLGGSMRSLHSRLFAMTDAELNRAYFQYLALYKIAFLVFNLAPYLALRIML